MEFHSHVPGPALRPFVDHFWLVRTDVVPYPRQRLFPEGGVTVLFNFGVDQGLVDRSTGRAERFRDCWISGERTRPMVLESPAGSQLAGIRFHPGQPVGADQPRRIPRQGESDNDGICTLQDPIRPAV